MCVNKIGLTVSVFSPSSDIGSEGSIAIVKKLDFDFLVDFDSIALQHSKKCSARGQVLHCKRRNLGCSSGKGDLPLQTQEPRLKFYQELNRLGSFPLFSASHSLFSIWTDLKRSEKIPGAPTWKWGEWICLTGPSGLHRNSPQGLNISSIRVFDQIRDPEIPINLRPSTHIHKHTYTHPCVSVWPKIKGSTYKKKLKFWFDKNDYNDFDQIL